MQKNPRRSFLAFLILAAAPVLARGETRLLVEIANIQDLQSAIRACVFSSPDGFPGDAARAVACQSVLPQGAATIISFEKMPSGVLAVSAYQDRNGNHRLDKNILGIPREPAGASRHGSGKLGPPSFKSASFEVSGLEQKVTVRLRGAGTTAPK